MKSFAKVFALAIALLAAAAVGRLLVENHSSTTSRYSLAGLPRATSPPDQPSDPYLGYFTGHWCDCWRKANLEPVEEMKLYEGVLPRAICPAWAKVKTLNVEGMTPQEKFLAQVFVGLVNRRVPIWYIVNEGDFWYRGRKAPWKVGITGEPFEGPYGDRSGGVKAEVGYRIERDKFIWSVKRFCNELSPIMIKGVVIYDPALLDPSAKPPQPRAVVNVIRTLCGVEQALPLTPELYEQLNRASVNEPKLGDRTPLPIFLDTRKRQDWMIATYNGDEKEAERRVYTWAFNNLWKNCDHHAICFMPPMGVRSPGNDLTDYAAQFKLFCFYAGEDTKGDEKLLEYVLGQSPMNVPVVGSLSWREGEDYLKDRVRLVRLFSRFGKYFVDLADAPNISLHSGERYAKRTTYKQKPIRFRQLDPGKTYVSFVLSNRNSISRLMSDRAIHWDHASRGSVPVAWSLPLAAADACPNILTYFYDTATENDYFVGDFCGPGEMFPSVYGAVTKDRAQVVTGYLKDADRYMGYMDVKELWVEQSDETTEPMFASGLNNLQAMLYGRKAARSYLPKSSFLLGHKPVLCTFVDMDDSKKALASLKEQMTRFREKFIVVGLEESAFSHDEDVVGEIARAAFALGDGVEVVRLDELCHLYKQAADKKLVDASPPGLSPADKAAGSLEVHRLASGAIKVDGILTDWREAGIPTISLSPASLEGEATASRGTSAPARASIAYDDRFLYLAVEVSDKSPFVDDYNPKAGDSVVLLLDTRPGRFQEPEMTEGFYKLHLVPALGLLKEPTVLFDYPTFDLDLVSNNRNGIEEEVISRPTAEGYVIEASIPLLNFPYVKWQSGARFRMAIAVNDADTDGRMAFLSSNGRDAAANLLLLSEAVLK
jgi:hypothetical protein